MPTPTGYTSTHTCAELDASIEAIGDKYEKPSTGIPKTDLASAVQNSLDKADAALPLSGGTMNNNVAISWADRPSTGSANNVSLIQLTNANNFHLGYDAATYGYSTYISGNYVYLRYGTSRTVGLKIEPTGEVTIINNLGVNGNVSIGGSLSIGGVPVVTVYSGSSAPSSSMGDNGDIYIQT